MWAHCFLMDWPLDKPKCSSPPVRTALPWPGELLLPAPRARHEHCQVHYSNTARWSAGCEANPDWSPGQDRQDRRFVGTFCPPWFSSLSGIVLHYFSFVLVSLPAYVASTSTFCLLLLQLRLCQGLYSISSFTYCARFVFPVSYLASWFTFFLI